MATLSTSTRPRSLAESQQHVQNPLQRLRKYIRTYVSLEGAAVLVLYLALWFWIGLLLDYGLFKSFGMDWVQVLHIGVRISVLSLLVAGLLAVVALTVLTRLLREFRDSALALVLERRFPAVLGDRLITAVELSDPRKAAELGYSAAMVEETIHEAAQRVETVPVKEVFRWRRLVVRGIVLVALTVVMYLLVGGGFSLVNALTVPGTGPAGFSDFHEVATIWGERNLLLMNTIWPRKAHLEIIGWPESGELRMGKGDTAPTIRVRALKYVIAGPPPEEVVQGYQSWLDSQGIAEDEAAQRVQEFRKRPAEGWRALTWFDLTPALLAQPVPEVHLPESWEVHNPYTGPTLDEIELRLDKDETHATLDADTQQGLRNILQMVRERAAHPSMRRILRELEVPDKAVLIYRGKTSRSENTLQKVADNEYTGQFGDLKESVSFNVQGLDYSTATRYVTVVDPPALETLLREEERPAYLYYRVGRDVKPEDLRGKKQRFVEANVSLQGGEVSRIEVPVGTNLVLKGQATKDLQSVTMEPVKAGMQIQGSKPEQLDSRRFQTRFADLRQEQRFLFRFVDTDGVKGQRQVVIAATEDAPPKIREIAPDEIIRKVRGGYMVSVSARIPFVGHVDDDRGLSALNYAYTIQRLQSGASFNLPEVLAIGTLPMLAPMGQGPLPGAGYLMAADQESSRIKQEAKAQASRVAQRYSLPSFERMVQDQPQEVLSLEQVQTQMSEQQREPYRQLISGFDVKPDVWERPELDPLGCDFPLWKSQLKIADATRAQPRYQMELWLEATDTDLDSEADPQGVPRPHVKKSDDRFIFIIVSENELLAEIAKDEEKLAGDMDGAFSRLLEAQEKLVQVNVDLSSDRVKAEEMGPMSVRAEQVGDVLEKSQGAVRDIAAVYSRLLREMQTNQVERKMLVRVETSLVKPLADVDGVFDQTREAVADFRRALSNTEQELAGRVAGSRTTGGAAKEQMQELLTRLQAIIAAMQKMTDINKLVKMVVEIEKGEQQDYDLMQKIKAKIEKDNFDALMKGDKGSSDDKKSSPKKREP